jgi:putative peptide zinc metalloprotease protein
MPAGLWQRLELRLLAEESSTGLWPKLEKRVAAAVHACPRLREGVELTALAQSDGRFFLLRDAAGQRQFRLGEREAHIVALLDGDHQLEDLVRECTQRFGPIAEQTVERFLQELQLAGLLEEGGKLWGYLGQVRRRQPALLWVFPRAEVWLPGLYRRLRWLFHPLVSCIIALFFLGSIVLVVIKQEHLQVGLAYFSDPWRLLPFLVLALYPVMLLVALTHEVAHALACLHFGGRVSRVGLMMRHLLPAAFADVSAVSLLPVRARVAVFAAGPASTALWAALATALWAWSDPGSFFYLLGAAVMVAAFLSVWTSLNPVGGYDGTEILSEWLGVPGLHRRALGYCWSRIRGRPVQAPREEGRIFWVYGALVLVYNILVLALIGLLLLRLFRS